MKIAIAGYGIEGRSSYKYFSSRGHDVTILDQRVAVGDLPVGAKSTLGQDAFARLADYDIVIRTPSLMPRSLGEAKKVWSASNEFFANCPAPIIGVTGTKGKGTTCSLIASILRQAGKTVHLVGNIGKPALDVLDSINENDIVVYEMSSFQLRDLERSPHIAVVLMIEPDHLDIHASFDDYVGAKQNIVRFQNSDDLAVFNKDNIYATTIAASSPGAKISVQSEDSAHVKDDAFWYGNTRICSISALRLPGAHNYDNACAAIAASWPYVQDSKTIQEGLANFTGLPHRLKFVREVNDVSYYDDSIATTPGSAIAALKAFKGPKIIILGGSSKGKANFEDIASTALSTEVKKALLIGDQATYIQEAFEKHNLPYENLGNDVTMKEVVNHAHMLAEPGDVVILSPACASFGMFKGYADRGDQFVAAVKTL